MIIEKGDEIAGLTYEARGRVESWSDYDDAFGPTVRPLGEENLFERMGRTQREMNKNLVAQSPPRDYQDQLRMCVDRLLRSGANWSVSCDSNGQIQSISMDAQINSGQPFYTSDNTNPVVLPIRLEEYRWSDTSTGVYDPSPVIPIPDEMIIKLELAAKLRDMAKPNENLQDVIWRLVEYTEVVRRMLEEARTGGDIPT